MINEVIDKINKYVRKFKWLDIEFGATNFTLRKGEKFINLLASIDLDMTGYETMELMFVNPSFYQGEIFMRRTLENENGNEHINFDFIQLEHEKVVNEGQFDPKTFLFKVKFSEDDNDFIHIAAENIIYNIKA